MSDLDIDKVQRIIRQEGEYVTSLLIEKNRAYGNSAISPKRFFSKADLTEQIKVRIDDKLNRLINGLNDSEEEDVVLDLIGYLVLLRVAQRVQKEEAKNILNPVVKNDILNPIVNDPNRHNYCDCKAINFGFPHLKGPGCTS